MEKLFDIEPMYPNTFCRSCENRVKRTYLHGNKVMQFCGVIKDNRNQFGMRRIKVTTPACELYKLKIKTKNK